MGHKVSSSSGIQWARLGLVVYDNGLSWPWEKRFTIGGRVANESL